SAAVMVAEETGPPAPELARRMTLTSCHLDPVRALAAVLLAMPAAGTSLGDIIDDSGYAHRGTHAWAIPLRNAGAQLIQALHPAPPAPLHGPPPGTGPRPCPRPSTRRPAAPSKPPPPPRPSPRSPGKNTTTPPQPGGAPTPAAPAPNAPSPPSKTPPPRP